MRTRHAAASNLGVSEYFSNSFPTDRLLLAAIVISADSKSPIRPQYSKSSLTQTKILCTGTARHTNIKNQRCDPDLEKTRRQ